MICASLRCSDRVSSDTLVATLTGKTAISEIKVGDTVEAYDPRTGVTGPHTVTAVSAHTDPAVEHLVTDTGPIETTPNHPFFTTDRGWVDAGSLVIGEQIRTESGKPATVVSFTLEATPSTMWDLTVEGAHSFFVGAGGVLVHNACPFTVTNTQLNGILNNMYKHFGEAGQIGDGSSMAAYVVEGSHDEVLLNSAYGLEKLIKSGGLDAADLATAEEQLQVLYKAMSGVYP